MNRRDFIAASAAAAAVGESAPRLAAQGGAPVRGTPLHGNFWGVQYYDGQERQMVLDVLETGRPFRWYGPGKPPDKVAALEKEFAARMQTKYALAVTSGTAALQCAMAACGIGPGDEVILPSWTWYSCFNAVVLAGALPVCAEIDETFNLDPSDIERHITPATKLIMAVHLQGNPADMDSIMAVARKHHIRVLEDCSQSVGASYKGHPLGSMGDLAICSMQANKTITAGEGGAVYSSDPVLFERAARFHDIGTLREPFLKNLGEPRTAAFIGTNFRMSEFTGGVLLSQLRKLDRIVGDVRTNAQRVYKGIADLPGLQLRKLPDPAGELGTGVYIDFKTKERKMKFLAMMKAENVPGNGPSGSVILPIDKLIESKVTAHPAWPSFNTPRGKAIQYGAACCPKTIDIINRFGGVLMDPKYTKKDCDDVVAAIRKVYPAVMQA
ncbi:MAG: DegT/DnrJ/EryC1/StrS family aminotransferase [Acidobacteriales bacterium]|nr:DegT/DnrJ/EryC1/StrS family aminotransferase [Terriglobales bacterium]